MSYAHGQSQCSLALSIAIACAALLGCESNDAPRKPTPGNTPDLMLGEPFTIGEARCSVESARTYLTEPRSTAGSENARVAPDVHALALSLRCRDATGADLSTLQALPKDTVILLISQNGQTKAPSARTWLSEEQPELLVFEVAPTNVNIARLRRYDARTGQRQTPTDLTFGQLRLETSRTHIDVLLRPRALTPGFEKALDAFMAALAQNGGTDAALADAQKAHHAILSYSRARDVRVVPVPSSSDMWTLTLDYAPATEGAFRPALHTLALHMAPSDGTTALRVLSIEGLAEIERSARCEREREGLRARAAQAYARGDAAKDCHVLGLLLPGACDDVDPGLLGSALDVLARCVEPPSLRSTRRVPDDFQLTLRRGRTGSALDRSPRYTLSLFAGGPVVFHGRHWVNQLGRSDGRTAESVLGGLYAHMLALDWFDRKGGEWSQGACATDDDAGNLITLHAADRERMILDRDGCRGPFSEKELDEIRVLVEAAVGLSSFTEARPGYADTRARIWTVE